MNSLLVESLPVRIERSAAIPEPVFPGPSMVVGRSQVMQRMMKLLRRIAPTDRPVLLQGPTGCGKEIIAQQIHGLGRDPRLPFLDLNCSALPENLIESELFGYERGAFTGAVGARQGHFARVGKGTLFLDEIGDLPLALQPKLLRVLETRRFRPLGSGTLQTFEGRIVAATHWDLEQMVKEGRFREDLFYRLNVFVLDIPGLDQRPEDIPVLAAEFGLRQLRPIRFREDALDLLSHRAWPGNVRQLRNFVDRLSVLSDEVVITAETLRDYLEPTAAVRGDSFDDLAERLLQVDAEDKIAAIEHLLVDKVLRDCDGNKTAAARILGVNRKVVERRVQSLAENMGEARRRIEYGKSRLERSEYALAIQELEGGLAALRSLPRTAEIQRLRFQLLSHLGICKRSQGGWLCAEAMEACTEALRIGRSLCGTEEIAPILFGIWSAQLMALDLDEAKRSAEEIHERAEESRDPGLLIDGHIALANTLFWLGDFAAALETLDDLYALPNFKDEGLSRQGFDPFGLATTFEGLAAFQLGDFHRAQSALKRLLERCGESEHPFSRAIRLQGAAWLECLSGNGGHAGALAHQLTRLAEEHGFTFYHGIGLVFSGYHAFFRGAHAEAGALMMKGFHEEMLKHGGLLFHSFHAWLLGRVYLESGRVAEALDLIERAIDVARGHRERAYLGELLCLQAKGYLASGERERAEQTLLGALNTSIALGSMPSRIEATLALAGLWRGEGSPERARELLTELLDGCSSTHSHPGLNQARNALSALGELACLPLLTRSE